jgi:Ser/Thr protein kinase RdoA (MazF antagonist)
MASSDAIGMTSRLRRVGVEALAGHLEGSYGIEVAGIEPLDLGTFRVSRHDGPSWVARISPSERPVEQARGDADVLRLLAERDYPSERLATAEPVTVHEGQALLVTDFVEGVPRSDRREAIRRAGGLAALGRLLGRLHTLPAEGAMTRPGGAWHHLADGAPANELTALAELIDGTEHPSTRSGAQSYDALVETVGGLDDDAGLPEAFVHPDFVLANVVAPPDGGLVLVDWTGAGRAARLWSLAFLLWSVGFGGDLARVDRTVAGYRRHLTLEAEELERLEAVICTRPIVFDVWAFCTGRKPLVQATESIAESRQAAAAIAARARTALA